MELTKVEKVLLDMIREIKPFELIEVQKDKGGKPGTYFITRTQKLFIDENISL